MTTERTYGSKDLTAKLGKLTIGRFLRTWREADELSLREFGATLGLSPQNLSDIEQGRKGVSLEKAAAIAKVLRVPPALLLKLAINEQMKAAKLKFRVEVTAA